MPVNSLSLEVWKGEWGLPSIDIECLKVIAYAKFCGIGVKIIPGNPFFSPKSSLPVLRSGNQSLTSFDSIVQHLEEMNYVTDVHLDSRQKSEVSAFRQYLVEKLNPAIQFEWWLNEKNYNEVIRATFAKALRIPFSFYYPKRNRNQAEQIIDALYGDNANIEEVEAQLYRESEKCFKTISDRLGESEFFFGPRPSVLDAYVFAYLLPIFKAPLPNNTLYNQLGKHTNLVRYVEMINKKYFKLFLNESSKSSLPLNSDSSSKDVNAFPNATRNKIVAFLVAVVAMTTFGVANGLFEVNYRDEFERRNYRELFDNEDDEDN